MRIWNQALIRAADKYPFFEKLVNKGDRQIDFAVLKDIPVRNMIDLDVGKTYQLIEEIEEGRLMDGFEYLLDVLYEVAKVLLGTTVKLPLEIDPHNRLVCEKTGRKLTVLRGVKSGFARELIY